MIKNLLQKTNNTFIALGKLFLIFLGFIELFRTIDIVYYWDKLQVSSSPFLETLHIYSSALALDVAMSSIFLVIPFFILLFNSLYSLKIFKKIIFIYTYIIIMISSAIYAAELGVYNEWEEKPTFEVFTYLKHPDEIINSNPLVYSLIISIILIFVLYGFYVLLKKLSKNFFNQDKNYFVSLAFFLLMPGIILLGARGGAQQIPIAQADAFFSSHKVYNDMAVNTLYNFFHSITENQAILSGVNPYKNDLPLKEKKEILTPLVSTPKGCERVSILKKENINIVLIALESWAGDFIDQNETYRAVIPEFLKLSEDGLLFTKAYASGGLSHEGLPAIFSGWPALYNLYITNLASKYDKLPSVTQILNSLGYDSMFLFGGQLRYGNLTSYIFKNEFKTIEEQRDMAHLGKSGSLGYHDGVMFKYLLKKTSKLKEPFLSSMFTLSSHSPYDQPYSNPIKWGGGDNGYINSMSYSDKSIGEFMKEAKTKPWYKNTLFIFSADHSHKIPYDWARNDARWHHIPILFYGDVLKDKFKGYKFNKVISQHDIAATLLSQLNINHDDFKFSRDVFCKSYVPTAYFMSRGGVGLVDENGSHFFNAAKGFDKNNPYELRAAVYIEHLLQTFLDY